MVGLTVPNSCVRHILFSHTYCTLYAHYTYTIHTYYNTLLTRPTVVGLTVPNSCVRHILFSSDKLPPSIWLQKLPETVPLVSSYP